MLRELGGEDYRDLKKLGCGIKAVGPGTTPNSFTGRSTNAHGNTASAAATPFCHTGKSLVMKSTAE